MSYLSLPLPVLGLPCLLVANQDHCFDRVGAPPHAAVRGGVPAVCFPLDEQPFDERAAAALHNQTMGHLPGTQTRTCTCTLAHTLRAGVAHFIKNKYCALSLQTVAI